MNSLYNEVDHHQNAKIRDGGGISSTNSAKLQNEKVVKNDIDDDIDSRQICQQLGFLVIEDKIAEDQVSGKKDVTQTYPKDVLRPGCKCIINHIIKNKRCDGGKSDQNKK